MKKNKFKKKLNIIEKENLKNYKLNNNKINLINVEYSKFSQKLNNKLTNQYLIKSFKLALKIIKNDYSYKLINGPINKTSFLNKKFLGITEYISKKCNIKNTGMLIYNKDLSVCPLTTHLPLKLIHKK